MLDIDKCKDAMEVPRAANHATQGVIFDGFSPRTTQSPTMTPWDPATGGSTPASGFTPFAGSGIDAVFLVGSKLP